MKRIAVGLLLIIVCLSAFPMFSQYEKRDENRGQKPEDLVREWFKRLNAIDGSAPSIGRFVELYRPDALQQMGPGEKQFGMVIYQDRRQIQKWIEEFAKTHAPIPEVTYFSIRVQTFNEKTAEIMNTGQTPWGDTTAAVEFTARYLDPASKKGYMLSGSAFFQFRDGQISRLRLYMPHEEVMEITQPFKT